MNAEPRSGENTLRVLFMAAEADPLIKVGGLGDVAGSLPAALNRLSPVQLAGAKMDVRVLLPCHPGILEKYGEELQPVGSVQIQHGAGTLTAEISSIACSEVTYYLVSGGPVPQTGPVYSADAYADGLKFTFTALAGLELARMLNWRPRILHANDWHTAMAIYALATLYAGDPFFQDTRTLLSIHNLPFLGAGAEPALAEFGLSAIDDPRLPWWSRGMPLPLGLLAADQISAVSPQYAREILTPEFGSGLHEFLQTRQDVIGGILNGIDTGAWDPSTDEALSQKYTTANMAMRKFNKAALQTASHLDPDPDIPLLILIGRMDPQKGVDIALDGLRRLDHLPWQAIILGTGVPALEESARSLEVAYPDRVRAFIRFDARLSRQMYAGGDILLMPSRYEPCGLAQMIAMRYGCIPFARATGGLVDTIRDQFTVPDGTGFLFNETDSGVFAARLTEAMRLFYNQAAWQTLQLRAMGQDFSWERSALQYVQTYHGLTNGIL